MTSSLKGKKILIVDDEADLRELLRFELQFLDAIIFEASRGDEAVKICLENEIDFVVSDVRMPKFDGIYLTKELRLRNKIEPPIILISAFTDYSDSQVKNMGAVGLIAKPVNFDSLCDIIAKYL